MCLARDGYAAWQEWCQHVPAIAKWELSLLACRGEDAGGRIGLALAGESHGIHLCP